MAVSPELLEILACPVCIAPVKPTADKQGFGHRCWIASSSRIA